MRGHQMEQVQGLQYRTDDGPTMRIWPVQHDFFPNPSHEGGASHTCPVAMANFSFVSSSLNPQNDHGKVGPTRSKNWEDSWEWDNILLRAESAVATNISHGQRSSEEFKSVSPLEHSVDDGSLNESTVLELGLVSKPTSVNKNDGILALTLGGKDHVWATDEIPSDANEGHPSPSEIQHPRCQVDHCGANLQNAKDYHRRHKVCELHSKASKALISGIMQRFCQQCSRFHLVQEFDDDRRSCRKRLAGHNRRRRKAQPDTITALASLLNDQSALMSLISSLEQLQGKTELEKLLQVLSGGGQSPQGIIGNGDAQSSAADALPNDAMTILAKSPLLSSSLLSNSTFRSQFLAAAAPANAQISADSSYNMGKQPNLSLNLPSGAECSQLPTTKEAAVSSNKLNSSKRDCKKRRNEDDAFQGAKTVQVKKSAWTHVQTTNIHKSMISFTEPFVNGDLDKQEQTFQLWFKIFDKRPADLPPMLRKQMLDWLDNVPTEMEGYIRPGCILLTIFVRMPVHVWEKLCRNIEESLEKLLKTSGGNFWSEGRVLVHFGEASAFIVEGKIIVNTNHRFANTPYLTLVQPCAVALGEKVVFTLKGHNLDAPGTKVVCAYGGKSVEKEVDLTSSSHCVQNDRNEEPGTLPGGQEQSFTFQLGPFKNMGHSFIEVEGHCIKGNTFPIVIAERSLCQEICSLEAELISSSQNKEQADIINFLHELGWLLHRIQWRTRYADLGERDFSPGRYRWLLQFSVRHGFCAVSKTILDSLFITDANTGCYNNNEANTIISEEDLLHVAVSSNSRPMVETLLNYIPPNRHSDSKVYTFRPDMQSHHSNGLTPLHIAASLRGSVDILDALTNTPKELWVQAWSTARDSAGQTPLMYALSIGNVNSIELVRCKIKEPSNEPKVAKSKPLHLSLDIGTSLQKALPLGKQIQDYYTSKGRELMLSRDLPLRVRGLRPGSVYRPFVLSMLAVAAVCVCVGLLMKGPPKVSFIQGPFVWDSVKFGPI